MKTTNTSNFSDKILFKQIQAGMLFSGSVIAKKSEPSEPSEQSEQLYYLMFTAQADYNPKTRSVLATVSESTREQLEIQNVQVPELFEVLENLNSNFVTILGTESV